MPTEGDESRARDAGVQRVGLCADCRFLVRQATRRGAVFYRCARAEEDDAFLRYPPIPVRRCPGYVRVVQGRDDAPGSP